MIDYSFDQIATLTGGVLSLQGACADTRISSVSIDTRTLAPGALYVPVRGGAFDGHAFIPQAFAAGAVLTFSEHEVPFPHVLVPDAVAAFQTLAHDYRCRFDIPLVGITGSVGKTTTKEMVSAVLASHFKTHYTKGNLNNQTGVPQVLFGLTEQTECAVVEMGTNHFGEIDRLAAMSEPTVCLITNIGEAHIEFFGSRAGIFKGKTEMLPHMRSGGTVIVNGDDDYLCTLQDTFTYGTGENCTLRATDILDKGLLGSDFSAIYRGETYKLTVPVPGRHMVYNALSAMSVGLILGVPVEKIIGAIATFTQPDGRGAVKHHGEITIIDDSYNANPTSMLASLSSLRAVPGRKILILGDMLELGVDEDEGHLRVLRAAKDIQDALILPVGPRMCKAAGLVSLPAYTEKAVLAKALPGILEKGDTVFIKGSHGMHLETLIELIGQ